MQRVFIVLTILLMANYSSRAENIRIGLFGGTPLSGFTFISRNGTCTLANLQGQTIRISNGESAEFSVAGGKTVVNYKGTNHQLSAKATVSTSSSNTSFQIKPAVKSISTYTGKLEIILLQGQMRLVNVVELEHYLPGVIDGEAGPGAEFEFYKVQATISRTYALNNLQRHSAEGFNLCDGTHCQVYHGKSRANMAMQAAAATAGLVIVDADINLITSVFHSNCGGQTANAGDVWPRHLSYCVSRPDTFCLVMPHSHWEKVIPASDWLAYLGRQCRSNTDTLNALCFMPTSKELYFTDSANYIPLRKIREDLKLRSPFFTVHQQDDRMVFIGKGFGHGVGLCQEGAMRMAQLGYHFKDIICYYYTNVHIMPRSLINFYKD